MYPKSEQNNHLSSSFCMHWNRSEIPSTPSLTHTTCLCSNSHFVTLAGRSKEGIFLVLWSCTPVFPFTKISSSVVACWLELPKSGATKKMQLNSVCWSHPSRMNSSYLGATANNTRPRSWGNWMDRVSFVMWEEENANKLYASGKGKVEEGAVMVRGISCSGSRSQNASSSDFQQWIIDTCFASSFNRDLCYCCLLIKEQVLLMR